MNNLLMSLNLHQHGQLRSTFPTKPPGGMVQIPSGQFQMGSTQKTNEQPIHAVEIGSFWMDVKPVTVGQFRKFVASTQHPTPTWSHISVDSPTDDHPIIYVSWFDAMAYAEWVGRRLPTEAEWEYAARDGSEKCPVKNGGIANFYGQKRMTNVGGEYPPNGYGLYDMAGNVWEWCLDAYASDAYPSDKRVNPVVLPDHELDLQRLLATNFPRVVRGGSWKNYALAMRVAFRAYQPPEQFYDYNGFRCVMDIET